MTKKYFPAYRQKNTNNPWTHFYPNGRAGFFDNPEQAQRELEKAWNANYLNYEAAILEVLCIGAPAATPFKWTDQ